MTVDDGSDDHGFVDERTAADRAGARWTVRIEGAPAVPESIVFDLPIIVGREKGCDIVVQHASVSRQHVRLVPSVSGVIAQHLGTTNGFHLNGVRHADQALAKHGDTLQVGAATLTLRLLDQDAR